MNIAIKCALIEAGIMKLEAEEPDIKELKTLMTSCEKLQLNRPGIVGDLKL